MRQCRHSEGPVVPHDVITKLGADAKCKISERSERKTPQQQPLQNLRLSSLHRQQLRSNAQGLCSGSPLRAAQRRFGTWTGLLFGEGRERERPKWNESRIHYIYLTYSSGRGAGAHCKRLGKAWPVFAKWVGQVFFFLFDQVSPF